VYGPSTGYTYYDIIRRDYTVDDVNGNNGIVDTIITGWTGVATNWPQPEILIPSLPNDYNFEYRIDCGIIPNPEIGRFILGTTTGCTYLSTDYGATFSDITGLPQYIYANGFLVQPSYNNFTTSFTGQYMLVQNQFGQIYRSTDYGVTWNLVLEYFVDPPLGDTLEANFKMSMSYNGQFMTAVSDAVTEIDNVDYFANYIWRSSDYGATWTRLSYQGEWTNVDVSGTGNYQITANGVPYVGYTPQPDNYIYQSTDYGTTWTPLTVAGDRAWTSVAINR
jgi:hypothetical protein